MATDQDTAVHLTSLPTDIFIDITPFLDTTDLIALTQTCHSLRTFLLCQIPLWTSRLTVRLKQKPLLPNSRKTVFEACVKAVSKRGRCRCCGRVDPGMHYNNRFSHRQLCVECYDAPENALVTLTQAKKEWYLSDKDLSQLDFIKCYNPHRPSDDSLSMRLYKLSEVKELAERKAETRGWSLEHRKRCREEIEEKRRKRRMAGMSTPQLV
jgi:XPA protein C-terminus